MIDLVDPDYAYTAGDYCLEATKACEGIFSRGNIPMFVGGTGLYIDSFFYGLSDIPQINSAVREGLNAELEQRGLDALYGELSVIDQEFASRIHPHDRQRVLRGLEVYRSTGNPISYFFSSKRGSLSDETVFIGIYHERAELINRINLRVDLMIANGLVDEVKALRDKGYTLEYKSMRSIGYYEIGRFLEGNLTLVEAVSLIKANTAKYAKRQMTWFRKNKRIVWFYGTETGKIKRFISSLGYATA